MEKTFTVDGIPYKIVEDDIYRLPHEKNHKCFNLKKLSPTWQMKYRINGRIYSMEQIEAIFLKPKK